MGVNSTYSQWSTLTEFPGDEPDAWVPPDDRSRVRAYTKYDQMYWNDARQYALRVLDGEEPIYVPNARTIIDTTSHYLLKDVSVLAQDPLKHATLNEALENFLKREVFYSRFQIAKHTGVAHGDFAFHLVADPRKPIGSRISLVSINAGEVFPEWDEDSPEKMIGCSIVRGFRETDDFSGAIVQRIKKLTYRLVEAGGVKRVFRHLAVYNLENPWWSKKANESKIRDIIPPGLLPDVVTAIPVYWFKNTPWSTNEYGSSDLRGVESILQSISQGTTDTQAALALEGLGVYATDGGRPIGDDGEEIDWRIAPGGVMEVPIGSKFWRVQGVGSITPMKDQLERLEDKLHESSGITAVALGNAAVNVAASGIALAIQFTPTLARIEERDLSGIAKLTQLFYDWKAWHGYFEAELLDGDIIVQLGAKLPINRLEFLNELNNMIDRNVISTAYYRQKMKELGYEFPADIEADIEKDIERAAKAVPPSQVDNSHRVDAQQGNNSNNADKPNESSGTEAVQPPKLG